MSITRVFPLAAALICLLAAPAAFARDGFYADIGLGAGDGNFNIDAEDGSDTGAIIDVQLGYGFENGLGLGGGISASAFAYKVQLLGQSADLTFTFTTFDATLSYFIELNRDWELTLRGGLSATTATAAVEEGSNRVESDDSSAGVYGSFGAAYFVGEDFALKAELFYRTYGVAFAFGDEEEITMTGLLLGVRWR